MLAIAVGQATMRVADNRHRQQAGSYTECGVCQISFHRTACPLPSSMVDEYNPFEINGHDTDTCAVEAVLTW
ncbi:hypothetical protein SAMN04490194_3533 [Pseudomonas migulae]|uniref:Uncharacterized protein n=1 Tax=Pseudomonas migulae TaxID=78543 RepID=A0A1H5KW81_9PSED|nr:hypothetical protein SAMN04490194_3533 [Pseudomonas migulae]